MKDVVNEAVCTAVEALVKQFINNGGTLSKSDREEVEALRDICNKMLDIDKSMTVFNEWKQCECVSDEET